MKLNELREANIEQTRKEEFSEFTSFSRSGIPSVWSNIVSRETSRRCIFSCRMIDDVVTPLWKCVKGLSRGKIYVLRGLYRARGKSKPDCVHNFPVGITVAAKYEVHSRVRNRAVARRHSVWYVVPKAPILTCIKFDQLEKKITNYRFTAKHVKDNIVLWRSRRF